jgi:hypothetical protein
MYEPMVESAFGYDRAVIKYGGPVSQQVWHVTDKNHKC